MSGMPRLKDNHSVMKHQDIPVSYQMQYWEALAKEDTLKYRWCDMHEPSALKVLNRAKSYYVVDIKKVKIVAEFDLESFTGKAAQIHFSMHPNNNTKLNINLATCVTDIILNEWKNEDGSPYLNTIFGLTAVDNRVATMFITKAGFKRVFILPSGTKYLNKITDAVVSSKERKNGR